MLLSVPKDKLRRIVAIIFLVAAIVIATFGYGINQLGWFDDGQHLANVSMQNVEKDWKTHPKASEPTQYATGQVIGLIRVPHFGPNWQYPLIQGIGLPQLHRGVSHYPNTVLPGQIGNFAIAAHWSGPFRPFDELQTLVPGNQVIIETQHKIYTYEITKPSQSTVVTTYNGGWVLDPVPGHANEKPTQALLTMTTCDHLWHSSDRQVAFGRLVSVKAKKS